MKKSFRIIGSSLILLGLMSTSCSKEGDGPENPVKYDTVTIGFQFADAIYFGNTEYGSNLYYGAQDQVTTGYLAPLGFTGDYAQFSINYGYTYDAQFNSVWGYSFYQGGLALSKYHNLTLNDYTNQLSVYSSNSPSGGNFVVAFGNAGNVDATTNIMTTKYSDYEGCGKVYITDAKGYSVKNPGTPNTQVTGDDEEAYFRSVMVNNTTYAYLTMKEGNQYSPKLDTSNGYFKVQFIAFDDTDANEMPVGYVEAYLANFAGKNAAGKTGILDEWAKVDLSSLPECSVLVVNFVGSDMGEYGLNTPKYCALDNFEIAVKK